MGMSKSDLPNLPTSLPYRGGGVVGRSVEGEKRTTSPTTDAEAPMQPATHPQRPALRKPLHPTGYTPALNLGGHNFAPIDGNVTAPGELVPERRIVAWRCRCGHVDTTDRLSADKLNAAAWAPCLLAVVALEAPR
jgi:hypothetical protein